MRIAIVLLGIAVLVYCAVQAVQRRRIARRTRPPAPPAPPVTRSSPRVEQEYQRKVRERAERQRRRASAPPAPPVETPVVVVDDDVFAHSNESFLVVSGAPVHHVAEAVARANARFMLVDEQGTEHSGSGAPEEVLATLAEHDIYTPNYAADPVITDAGVEGHVDCKGDIDAAMGETLRRVLREELGSLEAATRVRVRSTD